MHSDGFQTSWNCRNLLKTMFLKPACDGIVTVWKNENKDGKLCILSVFERFGTVMSRCVSAHPSPAWP